MKRTPNANLDLLLEESLCAYLETKQVQGSALFGPVLHAGHSEDKVDGPSTIIITATNMGGPLAYAGNYELDVQIKVLNSTDDGGMALHSPVVSAIFSHLDPEHSAEVLAYLNAQDGLGCSCYEFDHGTRTKEGRDNAARRHGNALPYKFHAHRR